MATTGREPWAGAGRRGARSPKTRSGASTCRPGTRISPSISRTRALIAVRAVSRHREHRADEALPQSGVYGPRPNAHHRHARPPRARHRGPLEKRVGEGPGAAYVIVQLLRAGDDQQIERRQRAVGPGQEGGFAKRQRHTLHPAPYGAKEMPQPPQPPLHRLPAPRGRWPRRRRGRTARQPPDGKRRNSVPRLGVLRPDRKAVDRGFGKASPNVFNYRGENRLVPEILVPYVPQNAYGGRPDGRFRLHSFTASTIRL